MATKTLPPTYDPRTVEVPRYQEWMRGGYFRAVVDPSRPPGSPRGTGEPRAGNRRLGRDGAEPFGHPRGARPPQRPGRRKGPHLPVGVGAGGTLRVRSSRRARGGTTTRATSAAGAPRHRLNTGWASAGTRVTARARAGLQSDALHHRTIARSTCKRAQRFAATGTPSPGAKVSRDVPVSYPRGDLRYSIAAEMPANRLKPTLGLEPRTPSLRVKRVS